MKPIVESDSDFVCDLDAPCFQILSPAEIELVKASRTQVLFRKGDNLTKQGTFASYVLFVMKGLARQYVESDTSKSFNLRIIKAGEFVGLSSVFSSNTFNYSSVAITNCHVCLVEKDAISKVIEQNGTFGLGIIRRYTEQNTNLFETLRNVLYKQMNGRMADTLIYIDSLRNDHQDVFQLLSRKDIADFAGISTESAVKLLKSFEKDGLIKLNDKDIHLLNIPALQDISKRG
ncbi:Crp/Fnr family transcriptional regulator [bacterium]|nr:Crp/Fnr family transcriptional regulator [bacterium]